MTANVIFDQRLFHLSFTQRRHVKLCPRADRKIESPVDPPSLNRGQTARFSNGDEIAASPVGHMQPLRKWARGGSQAKE
jgi:hypothetical protein